MRKARVDPITRAAIDWMRRLESGQACPSERQVFKAWLAENPEHMAAWKRVAGLLTPPLAELQSAQSRNSGQFALMVSHSPARKQAFKGAVLLLLLGLVAWAL